MVDYSEYTRMDSMKLLNRVGMGIAAELLIYCCICDTIKTKRINQQEHSSINRDFCESCEEKLALKYKNSEETCTFDEYLTSAFLAYELAKG